MTGMGEAESRLIALFDSGGAFLLMLAIALGVGAFHAVAPGHGKSITAAYLIGTHGRCRDAVRLGVIVAMMHTFSVLVLALTWVGLSTAAGYATDSVTAWLQIAAGLIVIAVGTHLTYRHLRHRISPSPDHGHGHGHGHGHLLLKPQETHPDPAATPPTDPWSRRGLIALALSGGLLPSPSAFIILVTGLLTGRALDAVILVIAFGTGMAATLTAVGALTIRSHTFLNTRTKTWPYATHLTKWLPALAGLAVTIAGCLYVLSALTTLTT
ncbi:hypothetical protein ABGB17_06130 [Sphaerisporangium sp. B11E5]|uniref:nickel/cobalt transporter n=1 Tax=Sphaerisporangium sp. B11E5 TaxID=3153563 RepID=UPI00325EE710